jgi:hypothetical protein
MDKMAKAYLEAELAADKIESADEYYPAYPATQSPITNKFDSYDKLQTGAPGKAAPKQVRN